MTRVQAGVRTRSSAASMTSNFTTSRRRKPRSNGCSEVMACSSWMVSKPATPHVGPRPCRRVNTGVMDFSATGVGNYSAPCAILLFEKMLKHALISVAVMAVLLTGALPALDACVISTTSDHACCTEPTPEPTSSCCSSPQGSSTQPDSSQKSGCDCFHSASAPVAAVVLLTPQTLEDIAPVDSTIQDRLFDHSSLSGTRAVDDHVRTHPPPPTFLLDCAYLI